MTAGFDIEPDRLFGVRLSATYFRIRYRDRISAARATLTPFSDPLLAPLISMPPDPVILAQIAALPRFNNLTTSPLSAAEATYDTRLRNQSEVDQDGIDLVINRSFDTGRGRFDIGAAATYLLAIDTAQTAAAPIVDIVGTIYNPVNLRGRAHLAWSNGPWSLSAFVNYTDDYTDNQLPEAPVGVDAWTTMDLSVSYRFADSLSWLSGLVVRANASNLFDEDPPSIWFVGFLAGGRLIHAGDGGDARLLRVPLVGPTGDWGGSPCTWSPDSRWFAYTVQRDDQVQLWRSSRDGVKQQQVTRNDADVIDFAWSEDGRRLLFTTGSPRATLHARDEARERQGYLLQDFFVLFRAILPGRPEPELEKDRTTWSVDARGRDERLANEAEQAALTLALKGGEQREGGTVFNTRVFSAALRPPVFNATGGAAWLERSDPAQDGILPFARLVAHADDKQTRIECNHEACVGQSFRKIWWSDDAAEVIFWRLGGATDFVHSIHAWAPATGTLRTVLETPAQRLNECELVSSRIICLRETPLEPRHVASIDIRTGELTRIADVNPELAAFDLGRVERIEWDTPEDVGNRGYSPRAGGFILYPPGHDPSRTYPAFVAPYAAGGFMRGDVGDEHPLLVYAANGIVVINTAIPPAMRANAYADQATRITHAYDPKLDYPHLTMCANSTLRGMGLAIEWASIDPHRIGAGGVSHGTFVPLYMIQLYDRFAALSVASGGWRQLEYYFSRLPFPYGEPPPALWPEAASFWSPIDLSQHLDTIEAPILFHIADRELIGAGPLLRRMSDTHLPYEAFSFRGELHMKWQPAHRLAIHDRNVDWFRYWLQDAADPDPAKAEQYERWRQLRELQCRNPRSLRDYCATDIRLVPVAR